VSGTGGQAPGVRERPDLIDIARAILLVLGVLAYALWGFLAWPLPWPGVLIGLGAAALTVVLWALFVSPRSVFAVDAWGQSLVELIIIAGAVFALAWMGLWIVGVVYGLLAVAAGYVHGRRRIPRD